MELIGFQEPVRFLVQNVLQGVRHDHCMPRNHDQVTELSEIADIEGDSTCGVLQVSGMHSGETKPTNHPNTDGEQAQEE